MLKKEELNFESALRYENYKNGRILEEILQENAINRIHISNLINSLSDINNRFIHDEECIRKMRPLYRQVLSKVEHSAIKVIQKDKKRDINNVVNKKVKNMRRITLISVLVIVLFCVTGCSKLTASHSLEQSKNNNSSKLEEGDSDKQEDKREMNDEPTKSSKDNQKEADQDNVSLINFKVFNCNDDATAFVSEEVQINALTPEAVLNALVSKGAVAADVQILSFDTVTIDNKPTIEIDFNSAFAAFVTNLGTAGEYFAIGSVCNTFLNAYNCEQIKITVEGQTLTTGHAEYPGYLTAFE